MKTLTLNNEVRPVRRDRLNRFSLASLIVAVAMIGVGAGQSLAQSALIAAPRAEGAATRERRATTEVSGEGKIAASNFERSPSRTERKVLVRSRSLLVGAAVVEEKLLKRREFQQLGFALTRDPADADLILELRHDLFTMYVFTVVDAKTGAVLLGGKLSSLGGTVAGKVAKRFVTEIAQATGP
jgi:hypothetical protein